MTVIVQQPYNLFAQQKMAGYPSYQDTQKRVPGQVLGETPEQFAAGKQAANSQTGAVSVPVVEQTPAPVVQNTKPQLSGNTKVVTAPMDANSPTAGMDYLNSLYTSPQEEERLRKANVMNQRILAIGDAVRHIGNIANTVNWAPAQQFNSPVQEEQARYEKGKAFRDRANQQYYTYQQQKAAQDRAAAKMEREFLFKLSDDKRKEALNDARISRYNAQNARDAANQAYWETRARLQEEGWPLDKAIKEARKAQIEAQTRLTTVKANQGGFAPRRSGGGGKGGTYWDYDEEGKIHYYPNKTMWEQGVESHSRGQQQQEEYKTIDGYGDQKVTYKKRPTVSKAGENAHNAANRGRNSKSNPYGDNTKKGNTQKNHKSNPYG